MGHLEANFTKKSPSLPTSKIPGMHCLQCFLLLSLVVIFSLCHIDIVEVAGSNPVPPTI
jgi:hypothetical protein